MLVIAHISCTKYTVLQWAFIWQKMCAIYIRIDFFTNTYILHLDLKYCLWQTNARMLGRSKVMSEIQRNHRVRLTFKSRRCWLHWDVIAWSRNTCFVMFYADFPIFSHDVFHIVWLSIEVNRGLQHCQEKCLQTLRSMSQRLGITCHIVMIADDCRNTRDSWAILTWHMAKNGVGPGPDVANCQFPMIFRSFVEVFEDPTSLSLGIDSKTQSTLVKSFTRWNAHA